MVCQNVENPLTRLNPACIFKSQSQQVLEDEKIFPDFYIFKYFSWDFLLRVYLPWILFVFHNPNEIAESFYFINYGSSIITSKVRQIVSVMKTERLVFPEKWYFKNSSFWHFDFTFCLEDIVERLGSSH